MIDGGIGVVGLFVGIRVAVGWKPFVVIVVVVGVGVGVVVEVLFVRVANCWQARNFFNITKLDS